MSIIDEAEAPPETGEVLPSVKCPPVEAWIMQPKWVRYRREYQDGWAPSKVPVAVPRRRSRGWLVI